MRAQSCKSSRVAVFVAIFSQKQIYYEVQLENSVHGSVLHTDNNQLGELCVCVVCVCVCVCVCTYVCVCVCEG